MRVRLTTDNLLDNSGFDLQVDTLYPVGWLVEGDNSVMIGKEWRVEGTNTTLYHPQPIEKVNIQPSFYNFVKVFKSAIVRGDGIWQNIPSINNTINLNNTEYIDELPFPYLTTENRQFNINDSNSYAIVSDIKTYMQIETEMLRVPNYNDNKNKRTKVKYTTTGREITSTQKYAPVTSQIEFLSCLDEAQAIDTFFKTCAKYRKGIKVEAWITPEAEESWSNSPWSETVWSGIPTEGAWFNVFRIDLDGYSFNRSNITGTSTINCIIQKTDLGGVDVIGTYTE